MEPQQVKYTLKDTTAIQCTCGKEVFMEAMKFRKVSKIISPNGKEQLIQIPIYLCITCGEELQALLPQNALKRG